MRLLKSVGLLKSSFSNINKHLSHICCGRANNIQIPASHLIGPRLEITQSHSMKWQREINKPILLTSCMYWNPLKKKSATSQRQRKQVFCISNHPTNQQNRRIRPSKMWRKCGNIPPVAVTLIICDNVNRSCVMITEYSMNKHKWPGCSCHTVSRPAIGSHATTIV